MDVKIMAVIVMIGCIIGISVFMMTKVRMKTNELLESINNDMQLMNNNADMITKHINDELDI